MKNQIKDRISAIVKLYLVLTIFCIQVSATPTGKPNSKFRGVQIGTITYSYRSMPNQSLPSILDYVVESGLNSVELMGGTVEQYLGIPQENDIQAIKQWRSTVSMDKFKNIRKMFKSRGVEIDILKIGDKDWSDAEIDYAFNACKTLGARGISMEISEEAAKRMEPFSEKHNLYVIFHNHGQPSDPNFSFDKVLSYGQKLKLNLDFGHYFGATGLNPCELIERLHDRIVSVHIKDKTGPKASNPNKNQQLGRGDTPIVEILQLIQRNKWPITCDIELEYSIPDGSDAVKEVHKCIEYCKSALIINTK